MGSGAERWAWIGSGELTSYDAVFPEVMKYLYKASGVKRDEKFWKEFAVFAANLNIDEVDDLEKAWECIAQNMKTSVKVLKEKLLPVVALYSIADHTRTVLVALNDGELPSNVGGGYNLRNLLRRCFSFIEKYKWDIDLEKVFKLHLKEFGKWYTDLKESDVLFDVLRLEKERYAKTREEAKKIINKYNGKIDIQTLLTLYESNGITPELLSQIAPDLEIPAGFYAALDELKERAAAKKQEITVDVAEFPKTENMYRQDACTTKFEATVIGQKDAYIILNKSYFYPRSGGQDYDLGTINGHPLKAVWVKDGVFLHELEKPHLFKTGEKVKCEIDTERRRKLTATHTAVHVVGDAARQVLGPHIHQAGSEKTIEKGRLDVTHYKPISFDELQKIEAIANATVKKGIKVHSEILPREKAESKYGITIYQGGAVPGKQLRILTVGNDVQACGGTHVENTKEIKFIKIINAERIKDGIVRIEMMVADKALEKMQENEKILNDVSKLWDVPYSEIQKTANKFFEEWKEQKKELKEIKESMSQQLVDASVKSGEKHIILSIPTDELGLLIALASKAKLNKQIIILKGKNVAYARSESEASAAKELEKFCNKVDGDAKKAKGFGLK
jgi:alanyl-tRNA synthetase